MSSLADYESEGGSYLGEGRHKVVVRSFETTINKKTSNRGVTFHLEDERAVKVKETFWLTQKAMWRLSNFAIACGLTLGDRKQYEPMHDASHQLLIGKKVMVDVIKAPGNDGKMYSEVTEFWAVGEKAAPKAETKEDAVMSGKTEKKDIPF